jgi:N-acetylglucosamine-6-sulfatase
MSITRGGARGTQAFIVRRRWLPLACGALLFLTGCAEVSVEPVLGGGSSSPTAVASVTREAPPPSIVLILTDDQRWDTLWAMPTVNAELVTKGISFENGYVSNPLCCPSRASILTGQYSHSNGVYTNQNGQPYGGFRAFDDRSTIATWLHDAGYRTAMLGKYFNGYEEPYVPPGWDRWFATYVNGAFYRYRVTDDGLIKRYGSGRHDYGTNVLAREAVSFIGSTPADTPLFLYFAPHAPHEPATPAPGDRHAFSDLPRWRPPSYDEADVSDKPAYMRGQLLDAGKRAEIDAFRRRQYRSLLAVDRAVGEIVQALDESGRLANTMIVFTSDNGMVWGEHRWGTKLVPYEESIHVPFVVRYDSAIRSARTDERLVVNVDLAPTFAELANVPAPGAEGASFAPLMDEEDGPWREDFLLEHMQKGAGGVPTYCGVHAERYMYVRYRTGEEELYDLKRDPEQLVNRVADDRYSEVRLELIQRLRVLCDPLPPGYAW